MASPGDLIEAVARATGESRATVFIHDRALSAAGLRTKKGRGRSAAHVTARDAANLLVAVMGSPMTKDSVLTVQRFGLLRFNDALAPMPDVKIGYSNLSAEQLRSMPAEHVFIDALEALIACADKLSRSSSDEEQAAIVVTEFPDITARIAVFDGDASGGGRYTFMAGRVGRQEAMLLHEKLKALGVIQDARSGKQTDIMRQTREVKLPSILRLHNCIYDVADGAEMPG